MAAEAHVLSIGPGTRDGAMMMMLMLMMMMMPFYDFTLWRDSPEATGPVARERMLPGAAG